MNKIFFFTHSIFLFLVILCVSEGFSQNVGIGTTVPTGKLQVNHRSTNSNPSLVIFDSSTNSAGKIKFLNAGGNRFWQINSLVNNTNPSGQYMDIVTDSLWVMTLRGNGNVGINNLSPVEKLDIVGNINLSGMLKVNGIAGTSGQVLTSNGTGDPQWKNAAYSNTTRFYLIGSEGADPHALLNLTTRYNTNTSDITVGTNSFTVNKTGLYHIEGSAQIQASWSPSAPYIPAFSLSLLDDGIATSLMNDEMRLSDPINTYDQYLFYRNFNIEIFITAGSVFNLDPTLAGLTIGIYSFDYKIQLRGHLISE